MHVRSTLTLQYFTEGLLEVYEVHLAFLELELEHALTEVLLLTISSQFLRFIIELGNVVVHLSCVDGAAVLFQDGSTQLKLLGNA